MRALIVWHMSVIFTVSVYGWDITPYCHISYAQQRLCHCVALDTLRAMYDEAASALTTDCERVTHESSERRMHVRNMAYAYVPAIKEIQRRCNLPPLHEAYRTEQGNAVRLQHAIPADAPLPSHLEQHSQYIPPHYAWKDGALASSTRRSTKIYFKLVALALLEEDDNVTSITATRIFATPTSYTFPHNAYYSQLIRDIDITQHNILAQSECPSSSITYLPQIR